MNTIKTLCYVCCPFLLAATLPLLHAQTNKDQSGAKAAEKELANQATKLNAEGIKLYQAGKLKEATEKLSGVLAIRRALYPKKRYPQGHPDLAHSLNNLAALLKAQDEYAKAELYYRDALTMRQALYPQGHPDLAHTLNNLGVLLLTEGEYARAEPYFRKALAARQALYPKERYLQGHPDLAHSLNNLGVLLQQRGEYTNAERYFLDALAMRQALYPKSRYSQGHPDLAVSLNNLGALLESQGEYARARPYYRDGLAMTRALYPKNRFPLGHPDLALSLNNLGALLRKQGEYAKAEPYCRDALAMRQALYPKDRFPQGHPDLAQSLNNLGNLLLAQSEHAAAEPYLRDALAMRQALYPKNRFPQGHSELAISLNELGALLESQGAYAKAEPYYRDALTMRQALYPKDRYPQGHSELANSLNNLGHLFSLQGEYAKAEPYCRDALAMYQALYPKNRYSQGHPQLANGLNNLGVLLQRQGEYAKAEPYYRGALAMRQALYPKDRYPQGHPDLAGSLSNLGILLRAQGEYAKAESSFRDALATYRALYPKDQYHKGHVQLATSLNNLGALLESQGAYAKAEPYCRDALAMRQALYPKDRFPHGHPHLAGSLNNLGRLLQRQREYAKAEACYRDALVMFQTLYPKGHFPQGHPELAQSLNNVGHLLKAKGEDARAEPYYRAALAMRQALYPKDRFPLGHPDLAQSLSNLGFLLHSQGEYFKAESYYRESLAMQQVHFDHLAETAAEAETLNFAVSMPFYLNGYLSVQRCLPEDAPAYDVVWKSRAPLTRILQRRHLDLHASQDPVAKRLALELQSARQRLARLLLSPGQAAAEQTKKLEELTDAKEDLEKRLARQLRINRPAAAADTSPAQLSKALPEGAAFIDLVRYTDYSWDLKIPGTKGENRTPRYMAFVLVSGKPALRVDLKEAAPIEKAWAAWRAAIVHNLPDRQAAADLAALIWQPLRKHLPAKTHTVWLNPDGQLAQVPWAALPGTQPNTIVLEELAIAVVPHGAFLLQRLQDQPAAPDGKPTLLAVGGVAFDKAPTGAAALQNLTLAPIDKLLTWKALPGTASEQTQIAGLARTALKIEPLVLQGAAAGIGEVSTALPKVRFAHLATHGFFADPKFRSALQVDEKQFERFTLERNEAGARSPAVLSGLVLAGANLKDTPARGILTAEAVVSLRLEDLDLAVLSACETGLGETAGGEGVFGLQRAFHIAGAGNVIASRWRVDDDATAALMGLFYRKLWLERLPPLQALREAQLHIYRHPEQIKGLAALRGLDFTARELPQVTPTPTARDARAHTSQWAAFVLSGTGK